MNDPLPSVNPPLPPESNLPPWVGLDIGGANLKGAHTAGWAKSLSFPLWKKPLALGVGIAELLEDAPPFSGVALTMTGELADCFPTRAHGVARILEQATSILPASMIRVYGVDGKWYTVSNAAREPWTVAASNWHALATYIGRSHLKGFSLLVDIGSTTTDIIPILKGDVALSAQTDSQRLQCGALVYTGIERSNVASISSTLPLFGAPCPTMNEMFASSRDVHLWLGDIPEAPECLETCDGHPATRDGARYRLARMVGEDGSTLADSDIDAIARQIRSDQVRLIVRGVEQVMRSLSRQKPPDRIIQCGHGGFLLEDAIQELEWNVPRLDWGKEVGSEVSRCAPAFAVAVLAQGVRSEE